MKKEFIEQILNNHNYPNDSQKSYFYKDIEIVVNQSNTKIKLHGFNHKTGRFLNLSTQKYSTLINPFKDISSDFYISSNYYYITLSTSNINKEHSILSSKIYGYARVSTKSQEDNTSLNNQIKVLKENGCVEVFSEVCSGATMERPEFAKLESKLQKGDTIIITKLDRFTRSTEKGISKIKELALKGVKVNILNMGIVDLNSPIGKMIFTILSSFAEYEKDCIVERMKEGKAIAKLDSSFKEGRPRKYKKEQIQLALELLETHTYKQVESKTGISKSTLIRAKKEL